MERRYIFLKFLNTNEGNGYKHLKGNILRIWELQVGYRFVLAQLEMIWVKQFEWNGGLNNRKRKN